MTSAVVTDTIQVGAVSDGVPGKVSVRLVYRPGDPFSVYACFSHEDQERVWWTFARSLLAEGLQRPAGDGDVQVWPSVRRPMRRPVLLHVLLQSDEGRMEIALPWSWARDFLFRTYDRVPPGTEVVDVDRAIAHLLEDA